jgi:hypothetical protein
MQKTILNEIYELLRANNLVRSESEFSKDWLDKSDCYMRTLRFKNAAPSAGAVAICAIKLEHYGKLLAEKKSHTALAKAFRRYSEQCYEHINVPSHQQPLRASELV